MMIRIVPMPMTSSFLCTWKVAMPFKLLANLAKVVPLDYSDCGHNQKVRIKRNKK